MPAFELTYEDYLRNNSQQGSETGSQSPISQAEWDALPEAQRWINMGGTLRITPDDPRFAELNAQVGDPNEPNRNITISVGNPDDVYQSDWIHDPGRIARGDGWYAISDTNFTPDYGRAQETISRRNQQQAAIAAAALVAGGMAYNTFGPAGLSGADALAAAPGEGFGTGLGAGVDGLTTVPPAYTVDPGLNVTDVVPPGSGPTVTPSPPAGPDWALQPNPTGGLPPESLGANAPGGMSVATDGLGSWNSLPWADRLSGVLNNPASLLSETGLASQLFTGPGGILDALGDLSNIPGLGNTPTGGGPGGGGGRGESVSMSGGSTGTKKPLDPAEMNPYAKQKLTPVDALLSYLRSSGAQQ